MSFDFEGYWSEHGIHTDPAIMGLSYKEVAQKAVEAALSFMGDGVNSNDTDMGEEFISKEEFIDIAMDNGIGGESAGECYDLFIKHGTRDEGDDE